MGWVAEDGSTISDEEMAVLEKHKTATPSSLKKAGAAAMGAAEAFNPLSIPRAIEVGARTVFNKATSSEPSENKELGLTAPGGGKPWAVAAAEAEKSAIFPDLSIRKGVEVLGPKGLAESLPRDWETYGGAAATLLSLASGAKGLLKGSVAKRAAKAEEAVIKDIKYLTGEGEGAVMDAMVKRPEKVREALQSGKLGVDDLAVKLGEHLEQKKKMLGETVGTFREVAMADNEPTIRVGKEVQRLNRIEDELKTSAGASVLSKSELSEINEIRTLLPKLTEKGGAKISPRDAVLISDKVFQILERSKAKPGNISSAVEYELRQLRRAIKDSARNSTGIGKEWALADEAYAKMEDLSGDIQRQLSGDNRASFVDRLLNKNKDPLRDRLAEALDLAEDKPIKSSNAFFDALADTKAAQGLKALDVTKSDPIRDQANRVYQEWLRRGTMAGATIASGMGAKSMGVAGAMVGVPAGGLVGRVAVSPFARYMGSPGRLLKNAEKAKTLSKEAKKLAKDMGFMQEHFGVEGANILFNAAKGLPAFNQLKTWAEAQGAK